MSEIKATSLDILAVARQATDFDDVQRAVYLNLLSDYTDAEVRDACHTLAARPRADYASAMPAAGDIRALVNADRRLRAEERETRLLVARRDDQEPTYRCAMCRDTGWQEFKCPGFPRQTCGREQGALKCYPHPYVERCRCWVPTYQAKAS